MFKFLKIFNRKVEAHPIQLLGYSLITREMLRLVSEISQLHFDTSPGTVTGIPKEICLKWPIDKSELTKSLDDFAVQILEPMAYKLAKKLKSKKPIACYAIPLETKNIYSGRFVCDGFCLALDVAYIPGTDNKIAMFRIGYIQ